MIRIDNKDKLQKELLEKLKEGIKPSDLKKRRNIKPQTDEGYSSEEEQIPKAPSLPNSQIKELQKQVNFYSTTANNHLKNLQLAQVRITNLEEQVKGLKAQKTPPKESELLKEKNKQIEIIAVENEKNLAKLKVLEQENNSLKENLAKLKTQAEPTENKTESIKTFLCSECNQAKPQSELSRVFGKLSFCLECSKQARQIATQQKQPPIEEFLCHLCLKGKKAMPVRMKLDETLQPYLVCQECRPRAKEFNEADLITDDLWEKYPYSSASEILEKEFGIKSHKE